jgi:hypothetical protein
MVLAIRMRPNPEENQPDQEPESIQRVDSDQATFKLPGGGRIKPGMITRTSPGRSRIAWRCLKALLLPTIVERL